MHVVVCSTCRLPATLCICALVPHLHTRTQLHVIVPALEARKPSNTGQLAARSIVDSTVQVWRHERKPLCAPVIRAGDQPLVLFPAPDAAPITDYASAIAPIALIVPDGSWAQARGLQQRALLSRYPCVTLPDLGPSEYRLRDEPQVGGLATFEAIARSLRILEGDRGEAIEAALLRVFRIMVDRTLWFRGKLRDDQVTGGVPAAALADDPRGVATRAASPR
jgi:DTW domain-containing protein